MKGKLTVTLLLLVLVFSACSKPGAAAPASTPNTPVSTHGSQSAPQQTTEKYISEEEAKSIVLTHAGFTADQVSLLRIGFEYDDGIPEYNVEFREGYLEYEYEIHAVTGQILSFEKDD